ncbi:hypothetical protein TSUD_215420 [Trifolium subterraneum]|uniref:Protein kinase domain-containing protein n=1 Tax=Trifolium subterraneum TaxID=3900 RepID=A0A2Z6MCC3_TRISU|nr:hypothetical protein TSUD_215420 [Trifolium subterraneum]
MIQTMSDPPPNEFFQFHHQSFPNQTSPPNYTSITTNTTPSSTLPPETINPSSPTSATDLGPEGRVSKPIRRRSRASRRTPTTLLNTDTTNFRAMVQQFTGGPIAPFAAAATSSPSTFSTLAGLGLGPRASVPINQTMMSHPFYQHPQQLQQQQQYYNMYSGNINTQTSGNGKFVEDAVLNGFPAVAVKGRFYDGPQLSMLDAFKREMLKEFCWHKCERLSLTSHSRLSGRPEFSHLGWEHWFTSRDLKLATNKFSKANIIGEGGYGVVYQGQLMNGNPVAIKKLLNNMMDKLKGNLEWKLRLLVMLAYLHEGSQVDIGGCHCRDTAHVLAHPVIIFVNGF